MKRIFGFIISAVLLLSISGCKNADESLPAIAEITGETVSLNGTALLDTEIVSFSETTELTAEETESVPTRLTASVAAVGDNLIHSSIYKQAHSRAADDGYDFSYAYERVVPIIKSADLAVINQETLICNDELAPSTYPRFNSPVALGDHMLDIGFDVFTVANNHTLDKDTEGLSACLDYWESRENAIVSGAYRNAEDRADIRVGEFGGITFSFLSYTESLNGLSLPQDTDLIIGDANDIETIKSEIAAAKELSDVCAVSLHWGVENSDVISEHQRNVAKQLSDAGADIIIGTHPHVLRDIEMIEREDGSSALCAYSLGNFISAQSVGQNLIGGALKFDVSINPDGSGSPVFENIELVPIITHYDGNYGNVRLYPLSEYTRELAESHGAKTGSRFGYDYIFEVLEKNISEEYFDRDKYYSEE